jgi:hypothetical protein
MPKKMSKACSKSLVSNTRSVLEGEVEYLEYHLVQTPRRDALLSKLKEADAAAEELLKEME